MSVSLPRTHRTDPSGVRLDLEYVLDPAALLALFVSGVGLILAKGPAVLMTVAGFLASYLRLVAPLFL